MPQTKAYNLRMAELNDVFDIAQLAKELVKETDLKRKVGFDWKVSANFIENGIERENFFVAVAEVDGEVVGFLGGALVPTFFSGVIQATELGWYVLPEVRHMGVALGLHRMYEEWATEMGAKVCNMMHMETEEADRIGKMYEKLGYKKTETAYMKEL